MWCSNSLHAEDGDKDYFFAAIQKTGEGWNSDRFPQRESAVQLFSWFL